ncbi:hypothetical protein FHX53_001927 [Yonghaparkia alkaliphila]|uniref:HTH cro/C1-type domain-containing protein n=1 Tax=Microcella alkalica TaxID=355930 RepID=A0A839EAX6_9MICO|nr:hypothetical protein [Microcella alkalica]
MAPAPAISDDDETGIHCRLDELLEERGLTLTRLSELVGVSLVNLSVLKNDRARDQVLDAARDLRSARVRRRRPARRRALTAGPTCGRRALPGVH